MRHQLSIDTCADEGAFSKAQPSHSVISCFGQLGQSDSGDLDRNPLGRNRHHREASISVLQNEPVRFVNLQSLIDVSEHIPCCELGPKSEK